MLEISGKTNLLEQNAYKYSLQDVAEPNLQRDIYTQGMVPKVPFNHRRVPMNMPEEIWITDTSLRDGQQSVEPYTVDQIVNIYKYLSRLGGPYGIIRQTEFFIYSKKRPRGARKVHGAGAEVPGDHDLDPRDKGGLSPRARPRHPRDGHPRQLQRLPHLQEDENDQKAGHGLLPCHRGRCV